MENVPKGSYTEGIGYKKIREPHQPYWSKNLRAAFTFDPASVPTKDAIVSSPITVTGAALGDRVELFPPYSLQGIMASGCVSAADTILITLYNPTGAAIDLASGTWIANVVTP